MAFYNGHVPMLIEICLKGGTPEMWHRPYKFLTKSAKISSHNNMEITSTTREKDDLISKLPDELLCKIISYLKLKDVIKTSVLSHRWKHLCSLAPIHLVFDCENMNLERIEHIKILFGNDIVRFVISVNKFLQFYQGTQISSFTVKFCLDREWTRVIDPWVEFAVRRGAESLTLNFYRSKHFSYDENDMYGGNDVYGAAVMNKYVLRSKHFEGIKNNLKHLCLVACLLETNLIQHFSCLESLSLSYLPLYMYDIRSMFSSLVKLKALFFNRCTLPMKLYLSLLPLLEEFAVSDSVGLKEIELSNVNLLTFKYICYQDIIFDLRGAPNIKDFSCYVAERTLRYSFFRFRDQWPTLTSLSVVTLSNWVKWIPETICTFLQVKTLSLKFFRHSQFSIIKIISILSAFPNLYSLNLLTYCPDDFDQGNINAGEYVPLHLTKVKISGFFSTKNQMKFAIYLLKNATALKQLVITQEVESCPSIPKKRSWAEAERQMVNEQLQKFAKPGVLLVQ